MELWKPKQGESISGIFVGFSDWHFEEGRVDWLLTLKTDDGGFVALPKWHSIKSCYLANRDLMIPKETVLRVTFTKSVDLGKDQSDMKVALIEMKDGDDWTPLFERRIIVDASSIAGYLEA